MPSHRHLDAVVSTSTGTQDLNPHPQYISNTDGDNRSHSTHAHMEHSHMRLPPPNVSTVPSVSMPASAQNESTHMARQDSGFSDGGIPSSSRRASTSTSTTSSHRRVQQTHPRPRTKRASQSNPALRHPIIQPRSSTSSKRPKLRMSHTTPYSTTSSPYQLFQFPVLQDSSHEPEHVVAPTPPPPPPPPATCQYWTSDSTRRLEYAAIDAASRGLRGFLIKLVPDCILPVTARRTRFHNEQADDDSDAGSVRRYRIPLEGEKAGGGGASGEQQRRPGVFSRLTSFGRRTRDQ